MTMREIENKTAFIEQLHVHISLLEAENENAPEIQKTINKWLIEHCHYRIDFLEDRPRYTTLGLDKPQATRHTTYDALTSIRG